MAALQYVSGQYLQTFTLASLYTSGSGTMAVTAGQGARLPAVGDFWIRQESASGATLNILKVTARSVDTLTVVGGQDGTTDQNIAGGTSMSWVLGVSALDQLKKDIQRVGSIPPTSGNWTVFNGTGNTITDDADSVLFKIGVTAGTQFRGYTVACPASTFDLKARIHGATLTTAGGSNSMRLGILVMASAVGKFVMLGIRADAQTWLAVDQWNSVSSFNATPYYALSQQAYPGGLNWQRIKSDGTSLFFYTSVDGTHWILIHTETIASFLGVYPTLAGVGGFDNSATGGLLLSLTSWDLTN